MGLPVPTEPVGDSSLGGSKQNQESLSEEYDSHWGSKWIEARKTDNRCKWTEAANDWNMTVKLEQHGDHFDRVITQTEWFFPTSDVDRPEEWPPEYMVDERKEGQFSSSNWDSREITKHWRQRAGSITLEMARKEIDSLELRRDEKGHLLDLSDLCVPIFEANNGDEYQILIPGDSTLPEVFCPDRLEGTSSNGDQYFQPTARITTSGNPSLPLPKVAHTLGTLVVRGKFIACKNEPMDHHYLHYTDYEVVVDMGHRDLPVWIMSSRQQLSLRAFWAERWGRGIIPYPIFDGLMATEDGGHDVACMFPSLRNLASCPPEKRQELYKMACRLVEETRATVDPVHTELHKKEVKELFQKEPDAWPIGPKYGSYFGWLREGIALVWESFTWSP